MQPARPWLPALLLAVVGLAPSAGFGDEGEQAAPTPRIYRWIDENGVAHYTADEERIPPSLRRRFGLPTQPLAREPLAAGAPDPASAGAPDPPSAGAPDPPSAGAPDPPPAVAPLEPSAAEDAWAAQERSTPPPVAADDPPQPDVPAPVGNDAEAPLPDVAANATGDDATRLAQVELRIAELAAAIAADEDALTRWIGDPNAADPIEVGETPEFREIAKRLPKRIQELEALRSERDALQSATP